MQHYDAEAIPSKFGIATNLASRCLALLSSHCVEWPLSLTIRHREQEHGLVISGFKTCRPFDDSSGDSMLRRQPE